MRLSHAATRTAVVAGATLLASGLTPAQAHDRPYTGSTLQAGTLDMRGWFDPAVYHAMLDRKLDVVDTYVDAIAAKVNAIPSGTVLTGDTRLMAERKLHKVLFLNHLLSLIPTSGPYAATASERAQITTLQSRLATLASRLRTLLANAPATPTAVRPATFVKPLADRRFDRTRFWTFRWWDGRWDGRSWDGHHCDHR